MIINPTLPNGFVLYCDDIRYETSGKFLFIGAYHHEMLFHAAPPVTMSNLAAYVWFRFSPQQAPSNVEFRLIFQGDTSGERLLYSNTIGLPSGPVRDAPLNDPYAQAFSEITHQIRLNQLVIPEAGLIRVRVHVQDDEFRLGSLAVKFQPPQVPVETPKSNTL